ncbi:MAG TPA: GNAT family N-acetyltransferase [Alphaproteobacteria bacterium]|nr:GNAT family N-acetyltransferase [Alphaproteobacteria bacterium]
MFDRAFDDPAHGANLPDRAYLEGLLALDHVIALVALDGRKVVGGLVACELPKLEQARSGIHFRDLAVETAHRRRGIGTRVEVLHYDPALRRRRASGEFAGKPYRTGHGGQQRDLLC